ncbi:hypothetical protein J8L86_12535 [Shewanella sp. MMG014]|uniref:hypothetical protein n=1 Tax=unclassified Shewanella TaxID=196818 RepID=UPI0006D667FB|nr:MULTISPECIES: hypothetical protein [unclassified Shewanella]KPZ73119.1 hypothetical protein AN944_00267 [Shewanella sp. P1-14-1]MBQ4890679.1 hypothetical protein [Shewanella sp. MMG014]
MIKVVMKISFVLIILGFSLSAKASFWSENTKILHLYPSASGMVFMTDYRNSDVSTCDNGGRYLIPLSHVNYDVLVSTLLASYFSGIKIRMNVDSVTPACSPTINRFIVIG